MPITYLNEEIVFPPVNSAEESGMLAVGGDLSKERLIEAYRNGIFPWYSAGEPILWWAPDPRFVLFPSEIKISKSMKQVLARQIFEITYDRNFADVILGCSRPRIRQRGTWITDDMMTAYTELHREGYAHSVEVWMDGELAGGLYGISLGRCFFGESMFSCVENASKTALISLTLALRKLGFNIIDCQVYTAHLESLGARDIPRKIFQEQIKNGLQYHTIRGDWGKSPLFPESAEI